MKALVFSDIHAFQHKRCVARLHDCVKALEWVFETATDRNIKTILFCGDLFQERDKIDTLTMQSVFQVFQKYMTDSDLKFYLLVGNHDMYFSEKTTVTSCFPFQALENLTLIDKPCALQIEGHEVAFLPYTHNPIEDLDKIRCKSKFKVLCGHVAVDGALFNTTFGTTSNVEIEIENDGGMFKVGPEIFDEYNQVFLGHYHAAQNLNDTVEYIGSPLQLNFGEMNQKKHILVYDFITHEKEYIENTFSPKHLRYSDLKAARLAALSGELSGEFVQICVDNPNDKDVQEIRELISAQKLGSFAIKRNVKKVEDEIQIIEGAKSLLSSVEQMLARWTENCPPPPECDKEQLLAIGRDICESYKIEEE